MVKKRILSLGIIASMLLGTVTPALANSRLAEPQSYEREESASAVSQSEESEETTSTYQREANAEEVPGDEDTLEKESKEETYEKETNEETYENDLPQESLAEESTVSEEKVPVPIEVVNESILEARTEMLAAADSETPGKYDSYDQFLAYYYLTYSPLDYYMDTAELPYQTYVKNVDDDFKTKLQAWRLATLDGKSAVEYSTKEVEFYELLIFDILYQDIAEDQILKNAETGVKTLEAAVQKDIAGVVYDWTLETELTADNASEIVDRLVKCGDLEFLGDCVDILKKGVEYTKTVEELIEKLYMLKQLNSCSEEIADILKDLYRYSTDDQMKEGCRQVALVASGMMTESEILAVFSGQVVLEEIAKYAVDKVWDGILKSTSLGKMIAIGQATGKLVANVLFSTDEIVENWYSMEQVCKFEEVLKARLKVYQNRFLNHPTCDNAKHFNVAADMYLSTHSVGLEYAKKYVEAVNGGGAFGFVYKNFTHKDDYDELIRQLDAIKSSIDQAIEFANNETQNFYQEDMKAMGYLETPVEKTPCSVTREEVDEAVEEVPDDLFMLTNQYVSDATYSEDRVTYADYYLEGTLDLAGKTLVVYGDFYVNLGKIKLNGGTLDIRGNLRIENGSLYFDGGTLIVGGDAYVRLDTAYGIPWGTMKMDDERDKFVIAGNLTTYVWTRSQFECSAGTIEIGGNWETEYSWGTALSASGTFKVIFSGVKDLSIDVDWGGIYIPTIEVQNAATRTMSVQGNIAIGTLLGNDINIVAKQTPTLEFGTVTNNNMVINGDLNLGATKLEKNMTINGDCHISGTIEVNGNELIIRDNLYMCDDELYLQRGTVSVGKNAYLADIDENGNYIPMGYYGILQMRDVRDKLIIRGDLITSFYSESQFDCSDGSIEIGGSWISYGSANPSASFTDSSDFKVIFTGTQDFQIAVINREDGDDIWVSTIEIQNGSSRKASMQGNIGSWTLIGENINIIAKENPKLFFYTTTGNLNITGNVCLGASRKVGGNISVNGNLEARGICAGSYTVSVTKNLYINRKSTFTLNSDGKLNVTGDVWINNGTLSFGGSTYISGNVYHSAGTLEVGNGLLKIAGDYRIQTPDESTGNLIWKASSGLLSMTESGGRMSVGGDFYMQSTQPALLTAGILVVMGDFYQISDGASAENFKATGTHTVMLAGPVRQNIEFASSKSRFNNLYLTKTRAQYKFTMDLCWETLKENQILSNELKFEQQPKVLSSGYCGDNLTWTLTVDGTIYFSGKGAMRNYSSATATSWYKYRDKITSAVLDDGITSIGNFAFAGLPNLAAIDIPESVTLIDGYAFKNSTALCQVTLPSALKKLGESAFFGCTALEDIKIPAGIYTIWAYTFKNCTSLKSVKFSYGLLKIDEAAFYGCESLEKITIPDSVSIIGAYCFKNCGNLQRITLPAHLLQIREASFYATAVKELVIPDNVSIIGKYAFKNCTELQSVVMPDALRKIDDSAFYACSKLTELSLPQNLSSICAYAFRKCTGLQSVSFPEGLNLIGESSFYGCTALRELVIPQGVTVIDAYAFKGCENVASVSLPSTLERMGESAFYGCVLLTQITIPESVTEIGDYAFSRCSYLIMVVFNGDMPLIGANSFKSVTADCYYPAGNKTWTEEGRTSYGGELTWQAYTGSVESNSEENPEDAVA